MAFPKQTREEGLVQGYQKALKTELQKNWCKKKQPKPKMSCRGCRNNRSSLKLSYSLKKRTLFINENTRFNGRTIKCYTCDKQYSWSTTITLLASGIAIKWRTDAPRWTPTESPIPTAPNHLSTKKVGNRPSGQLHYGNKYGWRNWLQRSRWLEKKKFTGQSKTDGSVFEQGTLSYEQVRT